MPYSPIYGFQPYCGQESEAADFLLIVLEADSSSSPSFMWLTLNRDSYPFSPCFRHGVRRREVHITVAQLQDAMVDEGRLPRKVLCVRIDFTIQMKLKP